MIDLTLRRFFFFIGVSLFLYVMIYFPAENNEDTIGAVAFDLFRSFVTGFLVVYVAHWMGLKSLKESRNK